MRNAKRFIGKAVLALAGVALLTLLVRDLWNWLMPALFSLSNPIDYWHALGLLVLSRILFGGFHGRGGRWRHQRWQQMSEEEREQFKRAPFGRNRGHKGEES